MVVDMEGVSEITTPRVSWVWNGTEDWERFGRDRVTADVVAAGRGALAGGAERVTVVEFHNQRNSVRPEALPEGVDLVRMDDYLVPLGGIRRDHGLLFMVGFHAKAGTPGILAHTVHDPVEDIRLNGVSVGEIGFFAASFGVLGLGLALVTGDRAACEEASALARTVETAAVKERLADGSETALPLEEAVALIEARAAAAVRRSDEAGVVDLGRPVRLEVRLRRPEMTSFELPPYLERVDDRTLAAWAPDAYQAVSLYYSGLQPLYVPCVERLRATEADPEASGP